MKKTLIIALLFIILGFVICISALYYIGFDLFKLQTVEMKKDTSYIDGEFDSISVETVEADLLIKRADDGKCKLVYTVRKGTDFSAETRGGVLTVKEKDATNRKWYDNIGIWMEDCSVVLYLPETAYESIRASTVSGDIALPKGFSFGDVDATTTSGDVKISSSSEGKINVTTTSGDVSVGERTCSDISVKTVSGDVRLSEVVSSGTLKLKSTSGDLELYQCDGENISIETVSGDVEGSFLSGKDFSVNTTSGDVEIPKRSIGAPCRINTVSGDIEIDV